MSIRVTTEPTAQPLTLEEVKAHLRVDGDDENSVIESILAAAVKYIETGTRRQMMQATYQLTLDRFGSRCIEIMAYPLSSVTSISYVDEDGNGQTLDSSKYRVDTSSFPGRIELDSSESWPTTDDRVNAVAITFVAGYATAADVPDMAKQAVKFLVAHWYEHRGPIDADRDARELPLALTAMIDQIKVPGFH